MWDRFKNLFHRHKWDTVVLMDGNYWTECACGKMQQIPPEDLSEIPPNYPIKRKIGFWYRMHGDV